MGLLPVVECLQCMVSFNDVSSLSCYMTAEVVRGCIPPKLTDLLLDLVNKKVHTAFLNKGRGILLERFMVCEGGGRGQW